jgi:5-methylcytosine-specific restriction endonuclease McrA
MVALVPTVDAVPDQSAPSPPATRRDAKIAGLKRYFTGRPCKLGHLAERFVAGGCCAECLRASSKRWGAANPEKIRAATVRWRLLNPAQTRMLAAQQHVKNREKYLARKVVWRADNRDLAAMQAARWAAENPDRCRAKQARRRAKKLDVGGRYSSEDVAKLLRLQKAKCAFCRAGIKTGFEVDHITPLKLGGSNRPSNLQLLCRSCNRRKAAKHPIRFAQECGRLL